MNQRGQAFTLEAVIAAVVLLGALTFAFTVTGVTPNTPSTGDVSVEQQNRGLAEGVLDTATEQDVLVPTLLYWNETSGAFHGAEEDYYVARPPPTAFGDLLSETLDPHNIKYNVDLRFPTAAGTETHRLVHHGTPSDHAARATTAVTLMEDDHLYTENASPANRTLADLSNFYAPSTTEHGMYTIVRVEVIVWRT